MISTTYNFLLLLLVILYSPKLLWQYVVKGKYRKSLGQRFGFNLPTFDSRKAPLRIWIHSVSVGETKVMSPLFHQIKTLYPDAWIAVSTTTETGQEEAKRSLQGADNYFFLPIDLSWIAKKLVARLQPDVLLLSESDFWYQMVKAVKQRGGKCILVNGKISPTSARAFHFAKRFSHELFSLFDNLYVQNEQYAKSFASLGAPKEKIHITGNLKLHATHPLMDEKQKIAFLHKLGLNEKDFVLVIGSTHDPEERQLLLALSDLLKNTPQLKIILAVRHPERNKAVFEMIRQMGLSAIYYSEIDKKNGDEKIVLLDQMGLLFSAYQIANLALVGGSFKKGVGGHNIFEPVFANTPVLFGPYMHSQEDLVHLVLDAQAGKQLPISEVSCFLQEAIEHPESLMSYLEAISALTRKAKSGSFWDKLSVELSHLQRTESSQRFD